MNVNKCMIEPLMLRRNAKSHYSCLSLYILGITSVLGSRIVKALGIKFWPM